MSDYTAETPAQCPRCGRALTESTGRGTDEVYTPTADPCGGSPVERGTADDRSEGYDKARDSLWRLCARLRDHAARTSNSKSGGPL